MPVRVRGTRVDLVFLMSNNSTTHVQENSEETICKEFWMEKGLELIYTVWIEFTVVFHN